MYNFTRRNRYLFVQLRKVICGQLIVNVAARRHQWRHPGRIEDEHLNNNAAAVPLFKYVSVAG